MFGKRLLKFVAASTLLTGVVGPAASAQVEFKSAVQDKGGIQPLGVPNSTSYGPWYTSAPDRITTTGGMLTVTNYRTCYYKRTYTTYDGSGAVISSGTQSATVSSTPSLPAAAPGNPPPNCTPPSNY